MITQTNDVSTTKPTRATKPTPRANLAPLPELARETPTLNLTHGVYIGGRSYWTVAALVVLLRDGIGRMTDGDLVRVRELGALAHVELVCRQFEEKSSAGDST